MPEPPSAIQISRIDAEDIEVVGHLRRRLHRQGVAPAHL